MVDDLSMNTNIVGLDTLRESDGLAMSSRNSRLTETQRQIAPALKRVLTEVGQKLSTGEQGFLSLEQAAAQQL